MQRVSKNRSRMLSIALSQNNNYSNGSGGNSNIGTPQVEEVHYLNYVPEYEENPKSFEDHLT